MPAYCPTSDENRPSQLLASALERPETRRS